ncbi:MAG: hypothetical protein M3P34_02225 [Actinomycetota bacterium]|nr:hypothetical protein [Actinomycetota bacterium]
MTLVAGAVATALIWMVVREPGDLRLADRTAAFFCFFPASFVLSVPYSEGLMLSFGAGCLLALLRRRWIVGGIRAGLATANRPNAVALCVACAWAAFVAIRERREWRRSWRRCSPRWVSWHSPSTSASTPGIPSLR